MIKCKEDLYGTYVLVSDKEAAEIYVGLINKFGISEIKLRECNRDDAIEVHKAYWCASGWDASFTKANSRGLDEGSKKLTISDLKPRTRTEYEKVTESIFDLRDEFEHGELYGDNTGVTKIETLAHLGACCQVGNVFRKVEKEIDWREEVEEFVDKNTDWTTNSAIKELMLDEGDSFLELCRVALRANGELD